MADATQQNGQLFADLGAAQNDVATPAPMEPAFATGDNSNDGVASDATLVAIAHDLEFTLTVGQAQERFAAAGRRPPSQRSIQRYCRERLLTSDKIRTTLGSEWLINEASLMCLIETEPIVSDDDVGDANAADLTTLATPELATPAQVPSNNSNDGVASDAVVAIEGERRSLASVLIENAKLLAEVEGRNAVIEELKDDRDFLREEVREARNTRNNVKDIAERMLQTLEAIALGRQAKSGVPTTDPLPGIVIDLDNPRG